MEKNIELSVDDLVEITLKDPDDFLKVKETLTRIGVSSKKGNTLFQSCHILHKRGKYYIIHFKELFALDGKPSSLVENDIARRNTITNLLDDWGLVDLVDPDRTREPTAPMSQIKIIRHDQKQEWNLEAKHNIGKRIKTT
ncbi:TPA: translational repressor RegA [Candidatus Woesearchaeota archaeon]|jgi:hypothetical protein|nr:translational repressor RegA [Candidatus Woesearchaeota archaeon]